MSTPNSRSVQGRILRSLVSILGFGVGCGGTAALAVNIAPQGSGILGNNTALNTTYGTSIVHAGSLTVINDGVVTGAGDPGVDTFDPATASATVSFVGIRWTTPRTDSIISLTLNMETFFDGGWFGPNSSSPGNGGTLTSAFLSDATVQFSLSADPTAATAVWSNAAATSNYLTALNGHVIGTNGGTNPTVPPAATWTLTAPLTGVTAVRLIGSEGGLAAAQGGFIGVRELAVEAVPEPSAVLALIGGAGVLGLRYRWRR
jgi:hypothetical protein